jgi:ABC-2 type transport system permease protein
MGMAKLPEVRARDRPHQDRAPAQIVRRWLIRIRAFFRKEVNELLRQPLLILSLIGGPLLVLVLFGASFRSSNPVLRTAIVLPPGGLTGISEEQIRALAGLNFTIIDISNDRARAEARLRNGELDVVQVLPADALAAVQRGEEPRIEFLSSAIDPMTEGWIQYLAYAEVNEVNKQLLTQATVGAQQQATSMQGQITGVQGQLAQLEAELSAAQRAAIGDNIANLRRAIVVLETNLPAEGTLGGQTDIVKLRRDLTRLDQSLEQIQQAIERGEIAQRLAEVRDVREQLTQIDALLKSFVQTSPASVVAPVRQSYANVRGGAYSAVVFYAPGVVALLVQHTAITLGALALVRERRMGAFEVFRVTPANMTQLLIGKYLGYTLFISLSAAILILVLRLIGIPLLGNVLMFVALVLLLTLASLGIGFLISAISGSDSQAIQLAMITLLLAIFFSGLFISLDSFVPAALAVSYAIPMTHGVAGFQSLMLRGLPPTPLVWGGLWAIALITFVLVVVLTRKQFQSA